MILHKLLYVQGGGGLWSMYAWNVLPHNLLDPVFCYCCRTWQNYFYYNGFYKEQVMLVDSLVYGLRSQMYERQDTLEVKYGGPHSEEHPDCSSCNSASYQCTWKSSRTWAKCLGSDTCVRNLDGVLDTWCCWIVNLWTDDLSLSLPDIQTLR